MAKLFYRILLKVFNFFGILNLKVTSSGSIRISKQCIAMNIAKVIIILYFNDYFQSLIDVHYLAEYPSYELTSFAEVFFSGHTDYMYFNTVMFILLQIWKRKDILSFIEEMVLLRRLFIQNYKVAEELHIQIERRCMRDIIIFFIFTMGVSAIDFVCNMNQNLASFVDYSIYSIPYVIIILMTLIPYLSIQSVAIGQEVLIESLSEDIAENSIASYVEGIGYEIGKLNSLLSRINSILNIQISLLFLYYLSETIVQV